MGAVLLGSAFLDDYRTAVRARVRCWSGQPRDRGYPRCVDSIFTDKEREYLGAHQLGRLATIGPDDVPNVVPVGYRFNSDGTIDIGGPRLSTSRKFHKVEARPRAAFVVDDIVPEESGPFRAGVGRGVEVRGRAEALVGVEPPGLGGDMFSDEVVRIYPDQIVSRHRSHPPNLSVLKGNEARYRTR
jgi:pyridoxamine 5'-phosphate oxidase family protein